MSQPISVLLKGGYDASFSAQAGRTTLKGPLLVKAGRATVDRIAIFGRPNLGLNSVAVTDGNYQIATVGAELSKPLVVLVKDGEGHPIAGQTVTFKVMTGGGTVFAGTATSDTGGYVRERWTLGSKAGLQTLEARAVASNGMAIYATFYARADAAAPHSVSIASGNGQTGHQLHPLPSPVKLIVKDIYSNPTTGIKVGFTANDGGTVKPTSETTNADGEAIAIWTLGNSLGLQTLSATVTGLPVTTFSAYATQPVSKISGDNQTIPQHLLLPLPLQVLVTDAFGKPVPGVQVTFLFPAGSVYVNPVVVTTDSFGKASWTGSFHAASQQTVTASIIGEPPVSFIVNVTPSTHRFDGVYTFSNTGAKINIINGLVYVNSYKFGTVDESDGTLTADIVMSGIPTHWTGKLSIDSEQRVTGTGTVSGTDSFSGGTRSYDWTCERL